MDKKQNWSYMGRLIGRWTPSDTKQNQKASCTLICCCPHWEGNK